jgi:D-hydroxyproline dehydrogenase subunit gamma
MQSALRLGAADDIQICTHRPVSFTWKTLATQVISDRGRVLSQSFEICINGNGVTVRAGTTVAAALLQAKAVSRYSVLGEPRQPLCGMGICYECRAQIDGRPHQRTCQIVCRPGMQVTTE